MARNASAEREAAFVRVSQAWKREDAEKVFAGLIQQALCRPAGRNPAHHLPVRRPAQPALRPLQTDRRPDPAAEKFHRRRPRPWPRQFAVRGFRRRVQERTAQWGDAQAESFDQGKTGIMNRAVAGGIRIRQRPDWGIGGK